MPGAVGAPRHRGASLVLYVAGIAAVGTIVVGLLVHGWGPPAFASVVVFWALHAAAELAALKLPAGTLSAGFLILMTSAFASRPSTAAIVGLLSAFSWLDWKHRRPMIKIVFNAAQGAVYTGMASAAYWLIREELGAGAMGLVAGTAAASLVALVLNVGFMAGVLALERRETLRRTLPELLWPAPNYVCFGFAALMVAAVYVRWGPVGVVFLLAPILVLRLVHRGYETLIQAQEETLRAFVQTVELKDPYTRGHSERVAQMAVAMFRELGADESELRARYFGALLHDVGKVAVPTSILRKAGRLTSEEYELVKGHPILGAEVAKKISFLASQVPLILFHHERVDGRGYPWGLRGDAIPLEARVLAVADTFDALTSNRPYREALSWEEALGEVRRSAGTQLDPVAVGVLERVLEKIPVVEIAKGAKASADWLPDPLGKVMTA